MAQEREYTIKPPVFVLVDCDNFFVSCERVFRPDLWGRPVVVLSNNDGCVVARSNEVKALGVGMAVPYFKVRDVLERAKTTVFSANFSLYGDFSQRVVGMLQMAASRVEVYSVDESFLEISDLPVQDYQKWAADLRTKIWQWLGVPVSIGVASNKTLAKAAAEHAKKNPNLGGIFSLMPDSVLSQAEVVERRTRLLKSMPVGHVWGIGWRSAPGLQNRGLATAYDLSLVSDAWAHQQLTIRGLGTVTELRGQSWFGLEDDSKPQQSLMVTRTFPARVRSQHMVESRVAGFAARAAYKLRRAGQVTSSISVFLAGDRHRDGDQYRRVQATVPLLQSSNDTSVLLGAALRAVNELYDAEFGYRRAGVVLHDLSDAAALQLSWLAPQKPADLDRRKALFRAVDGLNAKYHSTVLWQAAEHQARQPRLLVNRSPAYTTQWGSLPKVQ